MPSPSPEPVISFRQLTKRFPGVVALRDVSFDVVAGELHAIVGENGAGKSTLMKCLSGLIADFEGDMLVRGRPARFRSVTDSQRAGISMIHQELNLVDELSAAANIFLGREKLGRFGMLDDRAMERAAGELLGQLQCDASPRTPVGQLRVGDQQLVEIAKALSLAADILIMDEPTSALTEAEAARLFRVIERLRGQGATILYISHKMDEVFVWPIASPSCATASLCGRSPGRDHAPRNHASDGRPRDRRDRSRRAADTGRRRAGSAAASRCPGPAMPRSGGSATSTSRSAAAKFSASPA